MRSLLILCLNMVRKSEAAHYTGREKIPGVAKGGCKKSRCGRVRWGASRLEPHEDAERLNRESISE